MTDDIYYEENFLELIIGNFFDCIKNSVYCFQQYIDMFYGKISVMYTNTSHIEDAGVAKLIDFVVNEHENIIKHKGVAFANEVSTLLTRKYTSIIEHIKKQDENTTYKISNDAYAFFQTFQEELIQIERDQYQKKTEDEINTAYNLINFMDSEFEKYKNYKFNNIVDNYTKERILTVINSSYMKLSISLTQLRMTCTNSSSIYYTMLTCRKIITLMILLYHILSTIEINE